MKTYAMHSAKLEKPVTFGYNEEGWLVSFEGEGLTANQLNALYRRFPLREEQVRALVKTFKNVRLEEVKEKVNFEAFFSRYSALYGERADRKKAETIWNRLPLAKQSAAYGYVPTYAARCKHGNRPMKMAKTYLNQEPWND